MAFGLEKLYRKYVTKHEDEMRIRVDAKYFFNAGQYGAGLVNLLSGNTRIRAKYDDPDMIVYNKEEGQFGKYVTDKNGERKFVPDKDTESSDDDDMD